MMNPVKALNILLVEEIPIYARALAGYLSNFTPDLKVSTHVRTMSEAKGLLSDGYVPDIVVTDIDLPDGDGIDLVREASLQGRTMVLSMRNPSRFARLVEAVGGHGYVLKDESENEIANGIRKVARGETLFPSQDTNLIDTLTKQQLVVLEKLGRGMGVGEIANDLFISVETVKTHQRDACVRLGIGTASELQQFAVAYFRS